MVIWVVAIVVSFAAFLAVHLDERVPRFAGWGFLALSGADGLADIPEAINTGHNLWMIAELGWVTLAIYVTFVAFDADLRSTRAHRLSVLRSDLDGSAMMSMCRDIKAKR